MVALQTTEAAMVPGSNPASQRKNSRTGRVTVYTVKSRGKEGNLPMRQKKNIGRDTDLFFKKKQVPVPVLILILISAKCGQCSLV